MYTRCYSAVSCGIKGIERIQKEARQRTKANSNLHRAAALLAALCLLASMALPVYAAETETAFSVSNSETIPGDDTTGNGADGTGSDISVSN